MPLGNYRWTTDSYAQNGENVDRIAVIPLGGAVPGAHPLTLVKTLATASVGLSLSPSTDTHLAAFVSDAVSVRMSVWQVPGGDLPPASIVDPFGNLSSVDLIRGWAELTPTAVVNGFGGSFTIKYALPNGPLVGHGQRKVGTEQTTGICIAILDPNAYWPRGVVNVAGRWSYQLGLRSLYAENL